MKRQYKSELLLLLTAFIWGGAFVAQSVGTHFIGPWTFTCLRNVLAVIALFPVMKYFSRQEEKKEDTWKAGLIAGILLFSASILQQIGIHYTTAGKAGFITALYIVLVPLFAHFLGQKITKMMWIAIGISLVGFYLLSMNDSFSIANGDFLIFLCAIIFAFHILVIDHFENVNPVKMAWIQFLVCALLGLIPMLVFEQPTIDMISNAKYPILYAGLLSSAVGYTLQIIGQKDADPTTATLIMSLESVFAFLLGTLYLHETISLRGFIGCILILIGVILVQIKK
ncbi:MAG: DMT family transporter [Solobacterium sp.]|nr:DMT family transporter [Solobacterium sp.]